MAVTRSTTLRNASCDLDVDSLDLGTTNPNGQLIFRTSSDVEVATLDFSNPAFGSASAGTATASTITGDSSATGGVTTKATLEDRDNTVNITCSVTGTGGGGDIEITGGTTIGAGASVDVTSLTYTAGA